VFGTGIHTALEQPFQTILSGEEQPDVEQLLLYSHLASEISQGKKITTPVLVLTKTKEPVAEEHVREVNPAAVKRTLAAVELVWPAISAGNFYPAPSTVGCAGCECRAACRAWAG
jgi:hypothetical protein